MKINIETSLQVLGSKIYALLSGFFSVSCSSDEFYFFPQVPLNTESGIKWDRYDAGVIDDVLKELSIRENQLYDLHAMDLTSEQQIDLDLLQQVIARVKLFLSGLGFWRLQPTFYLTIAGIGLVEALESGEPEFKASRAIDLPYFLDQAAENLKNIPGVYRDLGQAMIPEFRTFIVSLIPHIPEIQHSLPALQRFEEKLAVVPTYEQAHVPPEVLHDLLLYHTSGIRDVAAINQLLDQEILEMKQILEKEGRTLAVTYGMRPDHNTSWRQILEQIPAPSETDLIQLYSGEINRLAQECKKKGILFDNVLQGCAVEAKQVPQYLRAIRTASSYSISPGHPPGRGTFYVSIPDAASSSKTADHLEYKMLCAHETYPGHHLMDSSRWLLSHPLRRPVEQPVYYEGWACFAEELMRITGYFSRPEERFLLAKRRYWRAVRGKVDLGMQTGAMDIQTSASCLINAGVEKEKSLSISKKYLLNPGYQLCYTTGIRHFLDLYQRFGSNDLNKFIKTTLTQGEVGFSALEQVLHAQIN
jgi:hypothetical protein